MSRQLGWVLLDFYKRKKFIKYEVKAKFVNNFTNKNLSIIERYAVQLKLPTIKPINSRNRINNRCLQSGRTHNVNSKFKLSRFFLRSNFKRNDLGLISKK